MLIIMNINENKENNLNFKTESPEYFYRNIILSLIDIFQERNYNNSKNECQIEDIQIIFKDLKGNLIEPADIYKNLKELKEELIKVNDNDVTEINNIINKYSYEYSINNLTNKKYTISEIQFLDCLFSYCFTMELVNEVEILNINNLIYDILLLKDDGPKLLDKAIQVFKVL